jgi:hypothetical protein
MDDVIGSFKRSEFKDILQKYPKKKKEIMNCIALGKFYVKNADLKELEENYEESIEAEVKIIPKKKKKKVEKLDDDGFVEDLSDINAEDVTVDLESV